jgi:hypothetical protein
MEKWENESQSLNLEKFKKSSVGKALEAKLNKKYPASSHIDDSFKGKDITMITNENGYPVTLFIGKRKDNGQIAGESYYRRIKKTENGMIKQSHWDKQGKIYGKDKK